MSDPISYAVEQIRGLVSGALTDAQNLNELPNVQAPDFSIEIPADRSHGDFATNIAMVCAKPFRTAPVKIAASLVSHIDISNSFFSKVEVAGPGFINFFLSQKWFSSVVSAVISENENYGRTAYGNGKKVMVEYVSANPTGPMHMGNARGGALGDCLASALEWSGHAVTREFYVNDAGNQIEKFGCSLEARYLQLFLGEDAVPFPEDGYHGDDIKDHAANFAKIFGDIYVDKDENERRQALISYALPINISNLKRDLEKYRITYDVWFHEKTLHDDGSVNNVISILKEKDLTYEKDGALWYKATSFGGEKDEVLVRANGNPTYFAADIAYHFNKFAVRGFDKVINVWGADHHGHVARLKGAMDAIGLDGSKLDIVLMQLVRLTQNGEAVKMSKRTGKSITLTDLLEDIPIDAARFFFNLREPGSHLDFDLGLAVEQSSQNPVYYVQYAHARICSILKNLKAQGITPVECSPEVLLRLSSPSELELIFQTARLPSVIIDAANSYDPAKLTKYSIDLASLFHKFYNSCRVNSDDTELTQARIALCLAVRTALKNVLSMMKITVPEIM
ncbi:MAG: arginine--tRNA ligase [Oscillospiraceae bacterium]|nr:arginine--tRNA ligase [Oscillospiraceae bacterium]